MRTVIVAMAVAALGLASLGGQAMAAKTKMGCERGKEIWNAAEGKCVPGKYVKKAKSAKAKRE